MNGWIIPVSAGMLVLLLLYIPEMFPRCSSCGRIKPRFLFRLHHAIGINPGYKGNRSVCRRCCRQYGITGIKDLYALQEIKKKLKQDSVFKNPLP
jgi:hypothetical protein